MEICRGINRSTLYNIEPIGIGTQNVESLTGYISRLANLHSIRTGDLISKIITPNLDKMYLTSIAKDGGDGFYKSSNGINGIGTLAEDFSRVLEKLTLRKDLSATTLLSWSQVLPTRGLLRNKRAWCSKCYSQDVEKNKEVYERLLWNFQVVNTCIIHNQYLTDVCPTCNKSNPVLARKSRPGYCSVCENWLGEKKLEQHNKGSDEQNLMFIKLVAEMLTNNLDCNETQKRSHISNTLNYYINEFYNGEYTKFSKLLNIPKSTFSSWYNGNNLPQIKSLLTICMFLGLTVSEFFCFEEPRFCNINFPELKITRIKKIKYNRQQIGNLLSKVIKNRLPLSIKKIAENIGCDRKLLYSNFSLECKQIKANYEKHIREVKQNTDLEKLQRVEDAFNALLVENEYPSMRKVEKIVGNGSLHERPLREKWRSLRKMHEKNLDK